MLGCNASSEERSVLACTVSVLEDMSLVARFGDPCCAVSESLPRWEFGYLVHVQFVRCYAVLTRSCRIHSGAEMLSEVVHSICLLLFRDTNDIAVLESPPFKPLSRRSLLSGHFLPVPNATHHKLIFVYNLVSRCDHLALS